MSKRLFGRCFLVVSCDPTQKDDLVILIVIIHCPDAPPARSGGDLERLSSGSSHEPRTPAETARS
jgi:hypothetical protein